MKYGDFLPFVHPSVISCPVVTIEHHVRQAAIEFCDRTRVWREVFDTVLADGYSTEFEMPLDDQVEIVKLYRVTVDGQPATLRDMLTGQAERHCDRAAWSADRKTVAVQPTPKDGAEIVVTAALKPSQTSFSFPDAVFAHWADAIASGALARLLAMPKTEWADPSLATVHEAKFIAAINRAEHQAQAGFARSTRPQSRVSWI